MLTQTTAAPTAVGSAYADVELSKAGVSWSAVIAGAVAASALSVLLLTLGAGLGLASVSPWQNSGATATTFAIGTGIFLIFVQWISSGLGGFLAGRLRTKWTGLHSDEVFFRDTAHGFLTWALATLVTVGIVASAATSLAGGSAKAVGGAAMTAAQSAGPVDYNGYLIDGLFQSDRPDTTGTSAGAKAEATRLLAVSLSDGTLTQAARTRLAQLSAQQTGIPEADAQKRVDDLSTKAKAAADKARVTAEEARKASAKLSFYLFFSMVIGAFCACVGGALGGMERDTF